MTTIVRPNAATVTKLIAHNRTQPIEYSHDHYTLTARTGSHPGRCMCAALRTGSRAEDTARVHNVVSARGLCTISWFLAFYSSPRSSVAVYRAVPPSKSKKGRIPGILLDDSLRMKLVTYRRALIQLRRAFRRLSYKALMFGVYRKPHLTTITC